MSTLFLNGRELTAIALTGDELTDARNVRRFLAEQANLENAPAPDQTPTPIVVGGARPEDVVAL